MYSTASTSELPLNIKIIFTLLVVTIDVTRCTVVGLYRHMNIEDSIQQLWLQIVTLLRHMTPHNTM